MQNIDKQLAAEWGVVSRLDDHGVSGGDSRCNLMHNEVQRMIERRNGNNSADWLLCGESQLIIAGRRQIHGYFNARVMGNFRCTGFDAVDGSSNLNPCVNQWLSPFRSDEHCKLIASAHHDFCGFLQDRNPFMFRQTFSVCFMGFRSCCKCRFNITLRRENDLSNDFTVKGIGHIQSIHYFPLSHNRVVIP